MSELPLHTFQTIIVFVKHFYGESTLLTVPMFHDYWMLRLYVAQGPCSAVLPTVHGCHYAFQKFPFFCVTLYDDGLSVTLWFAVSNLNPLHLLRLFCTWIHPSVYLPTCKRPTIHYLPTYLSVCLVCKHRFNCEHHYYRQQVSFHSTLCENYTRGRTCHILIPAPQKYA